MAEVSTAAVSSSVGSGPGIPPEQLLEVYRTMVLARVVDERCLTLQRQGRIGFYVPMQGQEAAQVGCAWALDPNDWLFPAYRELGIALVRKIPLTLIFDQFIGNAEDTSKGRQMPNHYAFREFHFVSASSPVGTQITQAVGAGMAAQRRGDPIVTVTFFGDGTTSSNDFHAGLNFAGVFRVPTIFFCQNNQWAISYPREKQTRSKTLAEKAAAYGFPGVVVDGTDVNAVYNAVTAARSRAISGQGPTLIEAQVYRLGPHSTSDDPRRYRADADLQKWRARDPIARMTKELVSVGILTEAADQKLWDDAKAEVAECLKAAEGRPAVDPLSLFDDVLAVRPRNLEQERAEFEELLRDGVLKP